MADLKLYGPPGCGKTYSGLSWLEKRVEQGADLRTAAFVSYTRAAVKEAQERLCGKFGVEQEDMPYARTLHSLCLKATGVTHQDWLADKHLETFGEEFGFELKSGGGRLEDGDLDLVRQQEGEDAPYLRVWHFARHRLIFSPREAFNAYSDYDMESARDLSFARFVEFVSEYEDWKKRESLFDFTDLMREVTEHPVSLPVSVAVIDEAQDLSPLMWRVVDILFRDARHRAYLGDDDQAIYSHDGAAPELFNRRGADRVVKLSQSRRLPAAITDLAGWVIRQNQNRENKEILPVSAQIAAERGEWEQIDVEGAAESVDLIHRLPLLNGETWYVLARNWWLLDPVIKDLEMAGIPYRLAKERKHNPWSETSPKRAVNAFYKLHERQTVSLTELAKLAEKTPTEKDGAGFWKFKAKTTLKRAAEVTPLKQVPFDHTLMSEWGLTQEGLRQILAGSLLGLRISERDRLAYEAAYEAGNWQKPVLVDLCSIHGKKGREAQNVVCMLGCTGRTARGMLDPARREEETRIAYVGCTRAIRRFYALMPYPTKGIYEWNPFGL